jgi:PTS system nitrogen regulatory IIA component
MAQEDFDIAGLAEYLHLTPAQVTKLAERGKAPGRKVGGQWRFSQAEVHHWLEDRIGASDEDELSDVEAMLERRRVAMNEQQISLAAMLPLEAIGIPLKSRSRGKVIGEMVELAARTGLLWDPERMEDAVRARESLHPTALDNGVALLHPRRP